MNPVAKSTALIVCLFSLGSILGTAHATAIGFDDLASGSAINNGYNGLDWNNFYALDGTNYSNSGYQNGVVSPNNVAYNAYGNDASISVASGTFTLSSGYFTAAWNDGLNIDVTGFNSGTQIDQTTLVENTSGPKFETFNWSGIDTVTFHSFGGTPNAQFSGNGIGTHFALDNLTVNGSATPAPEPSSVAAMGFGAFGLLALTAFRRKRTA